MPKKIIYYVITFIILLCLALLMTIIDKEKLPQINQDNNTKKFEGISHILNFKWRFDSHGSALYPPVVQNNIISFGVIASNKYTSFKGTIYAGAIYAVDMDSGEEIWRIFVQDRIPYGPTVFNETVCFFDGNILRAVDINTGKEKWEFHARIYQGKSIPVIFNNIVYFHTNSISYPNPGKLKTIYALDLHTGKNMWTFKTANGKITEIRGGDDKVYVVNDNGIVYTVDCQTGKLIWQYDTENRVFSKLIVNDHTVYIGCSGGHLYAVDTNSGNPRWISKTDGAIQTMLILADRHQLLLFGPGGFLHCIDMNTGREVWKYQIWADTCYDLIKPNDLIYLSGEGGDPSFFIVAIDIEKRIKKWRFSERFVTNTSPVIERERIFFGCGEYIYILDSNTGAKIAKIPELIPFSPIIHQGFLYYINRRGHLYAMEILSD